jgi:hypothetical protein
MVFSHQATYSFIGLKLHIEKDFTIQDYKRSNGNEITLPLQVTQAQS